MTLFRNQYRVESARLTDWDYSERGWYFVTVCTKAKACTLGNAVHGKIELSEAGTIAAEEMRRIPGHYSSVSVDCYVVMPNHIHAIVVIEGQHSYSPSTVADSRQQGDGASPVSTRKVSLGAIVGGYKAGVSRICRARGIDGFAWQARFHERIFGKQCGGGRGAGLHR